MRQNRTTIEINGKQYDAQTGRLISGQPSSVTAGPAMKTVDGFTAPARNHLAHQGTQRQTQPAADVHHAQHRSETLRRQSVKKPMTSAQTASPHAAPTAATAKPASPIHHVTQTIARHPLTVSGSFMHQNEAIPDKAYRAKAVNRSHLVSKFGGLGNEHGVVKKVESLEVKSAPPGDRHTAIERPHHEAPLPPRGAAQAYSRGSLENAALLDRGIERATAHETAPHHRVSHRHRVARRMGIHPNLINIGAASLIGLLLIGFFVYQNNANIAMRVAASKSGVAAAKPATVPPGYALDGPIRYAPGLVTLSYGSHGSNKGFTLSEQTSEWTSSTLFSNMFADGTVAYQTHQQNGLTVYTYGEGNATWVSGGIRYDITGDAGLNSSQILKIATSL